MNSHNEKKENNDIDESLLRDHVFDGIQEYDNKLPNWWLMTLYGAILFSFGYWFVYHISEAGASPEEKFARAQALAASYAATRGESDFTDQRLIAMSTDSGLVGSGKSSYALNCAACHGVNAEGGIGPNLKDGEWVHGGQPTQILHVILEGVAAKGMPPWKASLGEARSAEITAFLISLDLESFQNAEPASSGTGEL